MINEYEITEEELIACGGHCPECGEILKFDMTDGHYLHDGDYFVPPTYEIDRYHYHCPKCGAQYSTEHEL
jgi:ribosomal protein S27AE